MGFRFRAAQCLICYVQIFVVWIMIAHDSITYCVSLYVQVAAHEEVWLTFLMVCNLLTGVYAWLVSVSHTITITTVYLVL